METLQLGWNVANDVERFDVTPHEFDSRMERLYREGDGFIFETVVFWATPVRQKWLSQALDRICQYAAERGVSRSDVHILMLGDGAGSDSSFLAKNGFQVDYFDVPGSATYDFALRRFDRLGFLNNSIRVIGKYEDCLAGNYDVVFSFEVLEHLPDPVAAIQDLADALKNGGMALVTESFGVCTPGFATHLRSNLRFAGRTPFLFLSNRLKLEWYSRETLFRPMQFMKVERYRPQDFLGLVNDRNVRRVWCRHRIRDLKRALEDHMGKR